MDFLPPEPADVVNVQRLNLAFLEMTRHPARPLQELAPLPPEQDSVLMALDRSGLQRLARCPFLLFSLSEGDSSRWEALFEGPGAGDLLDALHRPGVDEARIASMALGFLWQLANRSPYAARVVSGAAVEWCQRLAKSTLVQLFELAASEGGLLQYRYADNSAFWNKLIAAGTSNEEPVRVAAQLAAMQRMLTAEAFDRSDERLPAAACSMPRPARRVAEHPGISKHGRRGYNTPPDESPVNKKAHQNLRER